MTRRHSLESRRCATRAAFAGYRVAHSTSGRKARPDLCDSVGTEKLKLRLGCGDKAARDANRLPVVCVARADQEVAIATARCTRVTFGLGASRQR